MPAIFFDLDGTLTDPAPGIIESLQHALRELGEAVPPAPALRRFIGPPLRAIFSELIENADDADIENAVGHYRFHYDVNGLFENRLIPGVTELLRGVKNAGIPAYAVTSKSQSTAIRIVEHFSLTPFFLRVYGSQPDGTLSAMRALIASVLKREALDPNEVLMIGDRHHDIDGAKICGVDSIGVTYGYGTREELETAGASRICDDPADIMRALRAHFPRSFIPPDVVGLERARDRWRRAERTRPSGIQAPGPGQESVWDYPRPPRVEDVSKRVRVLFGGEVVADSTRAKRILETSSPPVYYVPVADVRDEFLTPSEHWTLCEWKGVARYSSVRVGEQIAENAAWSYPEPDADFESIRDYIAFHAGRVDECWVDDERVTPQPGEYYGGWITANLVGPFKGENGTERW